MSGGGKGGSNQTVAYYYVPIAFAICEGPIIGIKRMWAGGNLIYSDSQPVAVNSYQGGGKKSGPSVSTSYQQFTSTTQNDIQKGGSSLGPWTCYLGTETQPADPTIGEGVAYRGMAYIVFNPLNIGPGATVPPLSFEVITQGTFNPMAVVWQKQIDSAGLGPNGLGLAFDSNGNPVVPMRFSQILNLLPESEAGQYVGLNTFSKDTGDLIKTTIQGMFNQTYAPFYYQSIIQPGGAGSPVISPVVNANDILNLYWGTLDPDGGPATMIEEHAPPIQDWLYSDGDYIVGTFNDFGNNVYAYSLQGNPVNPFLDKHQEPKYVMMPSVSLGGNDIVGHLINGYLYAEAFYSVYNGPPILGPGIVGIKVASFGPEEAFLVSSLPICFCPTEDRQSFWVSFTQNGENYIGNMALDGTIISQFSTGSNLFQRLHAAYGFIFAFVEQPNIVAAGIYKFSQFGALIDHLDQISLNLGANFKVNSCGDGFLYINNDAMGYLESILKLDPGGRIIIAGPMTLPAAVTILCERAGLTQFDVSQLPATPVNFVRGDTVTARSMLQRLSQAYFFSMVDSGGTLKFIPQGQPSQAVIPLEDLGYGKVTANAQTPFTSTRISGVDLPRSVKIRYYSAALNYNHYEQVFALESYDSGKEITLDLPLILDDQTAYNIAALACTLPHAEREQYSFTTSYKWLALEPGDVVTLPFGVCRILTIKMGQKNGIPVIDFTACIDGMNSLAGAGYAKPALPNYGGITGLLATPSNLAPVQTPGSSTPHPIAGAPTIEQSVPNAGTPKMVLVEPPPLKSTDTGMRFYTGAYSTGNVFPGAGVFQSSDGGDTYSQIATEISSASAGYANTILGSPTAQQGSYTWDTINTVDIYMIGNGADPTPMTDLQVMNGANGAMLGQELIQFAQATLMLDSSGNPFYRLSRLLRGRRGTEWAMGSHSIGESFYPIPASLTKESYTPPMLNNAYLYKVVMMGGDLGNAYPISFEPNGNSLRQWAVCQPAVSKDPSGDWTVTWVPRARYNGDWTSGYIPTLDPDTAGWSIDVLSSGSVVRTIAVPLVTTAPWQAIYTAAMQTADGFTPGQSGIVFNIYQLSTQVGRGTVRSITTP